MNTNDKQHTDHTPGSRPALEDLLRRAAARAPDQDVQARLRRARLLAVNRLEQAQRPRDWAPVAAFATAATLALVFMLRGPAPSALPDLTTDPVAALYVYAGEDAELAEELEFYLWLDRQGNAG